MDSTSQQTFSRKFTLKRLALNIAALSVVLALATSHPIAAAAFASLILLIAPTAFVCAVAYWISLNRRRTIIIVLAGAIIGWILAPQIQVNWGPDHTFWDEFVIDFKSVGVFMFGGSLVAAFAEYVLAKIAKRNPSR